MGSERKSMWMISRCMRRDVHAVTLGGVWSRSMESATEDDIERFKASAAYETYSASPYCKTGGGR